MLYGRYLQDKLHTSTLFAKVPLGSKIPIALCVSEAGFGRNEKQI
jgi:hypothetical protein